MNRKKLKYIGIILIGIGFIMMAASNALNSEIASALQAVTGALFIFMAIMKIVAKKND